MFLATCKSHQMMDILGDGINHDWWKRNTAGGGRNIQIKQFTASAHQPWISGVIAVARFERKAVTAFTATHPVCMKSKTLSRTGIVNLGQTAGVTGVQRHCASAAQHLLLVPQVSLL
jgi:hypothetical protein